MAATARHESAPDTSLENVTLVVCTLNEEGNVGPILRRVPPVVTEILVVDGNSTDGTVGEALAAGERVRVVQQTGRGKGGALRQGFREARGGIVVQMDADGSMDPAEIERYVDAIRDGADVVKGSRMLHGAGSSDLTAFRRFGNWCFCKMANVRHGARFTDICYGFMAFRREVLESIRLTADGFDIEAEIALEAHAAGYRIVEIPTFEHDRIHGDSHLHAFRDGWDILRAVLRSTSEPRTAPVTVVPGLAHGRALGLAPAARAPSPTIETDHSEAPARRSHAERSRGGGHTP